MRTLQGHLPTGFEADAAGTTGNKYDLTRKIVHVFASLKLLVVNVYLPGLGKSGVEVTAAPHQVWPGWENYFLTA
jgi:hypothetical protein